MTVSHLPNHSEFSPTDPWRHGLATAGGKFMVTNSVGKKWLHL